MLKRLLFISLALSLLLNTSTAQVSTNNWYVGNTASSEWIKFKQVWLSEGHYRFTTKAVASKEGQTVHLALNGEILEEQIEIPTNNNGEFELVHLGHKQLSTGYYDIRLVFETGNVNCDMIFIRKDDNAGNEVKDNDVSYSINRNDGMHIAPIGGVWGASAQLAKGGEKGDHDGGWYDANHNLYTREQILSWYKQQIYVYTPEVTDQAIDMYVSEQVEAKVDFIFSHGRGENDFENDIEDRAYLSGVGGFGCRQLKKLVEAINRNVYAKDNLKIAYFIDNAVFPLAVEHYLGKTMNWGDVECQEFLWNYCFKNFYETVPREMLFERSPGVIPIQLWSANANYNYSVSDNKILEFLEYIKEKMQQNYGLTPSFILDNTFFDRDPRTKSIADGIQSWFTWGGDIISFRTFNDKKYGFSLNGGRLPLRSVWLNDWDPLTNSGTHQGNTTDYHHSSLGADNTPSIRPMFEYGAANNFEWMVNESWFDWQEGSTWYRSNHSEYLWPNQYIALEREFADRESQSILLEAEACDEFSDRSPGNSGGAYRVNWYTDLKQDFYDTDMSIDLDIYRPLHQLPEIIDGGELGTGVENLSAGGFDVWAITTNGDIMCQEIDGHPINWKKITSVLPGVKKIAVGRYHAWALTTDNKVMSTELPQGWSSNNCTGWKDITDDHPMKDIDLNMSRGWAIDMGGKVFYRDLSAKKTWTEVPGVLKAITADDEFIWGFTETDSIVRMSVQSRQKWDTIPNSYNLIKLEGGATEVWGINAQDEIYRINSSGDGDWQFVISGYNNVSVGYEQVWLSKQDGKVYHYPLKGFESTTVFARDTSNLSPASAVSPPLTKNWNIKYYPNPFNSSLHIDILSLVDGTALLNLYDLHGRLLKCHEVNLKRGYNDFHLDDLQELKKGIYILEFSCGEETTHFKVMN